MPLIRGLNLCKHNFVWKDFPLGKPAQVLSSWGIDSSEWTRRRKQRSIQLYSEVPGYVFIVNRTRLLTWHWLCRHDNCNSDGVFRAWTKNLETSEVGDLCQGCISSVTLWRGHCTKLKVNLKVPWTLRVYMLWTFLLTRFCFFFCKWFVPVKYHS